MEIEFTLSDIEGKEFPPEKIDQLFAALGISDQSEIESILKNISQASAIEYIEMLIGKGMANRADEAKQDRLFYLIKKVFAPRIPPDDQISVMFQLTATQSKSLLRNTLSRYRTELSDEIEITLSEIYKSAVQDKNSWDVSIESEVFVELLNQRVAREGAEYPPIRKRREGNSKYWINVDTYRVLGECFG